MALTQNNLSLIRAVASGDQYLARTYAIASCKEDASKKNAVYIATLMEKLSAADQPGKPVIPSHLCGKLSVYDPAEFREARYYLTPDRTSLMNDIIEADAVAGAMRELGIPFINSTLISGPPGTGKTDFARYMAKKMGLPLLYINISSLISSYMGATGQNLHQILEFCKTFRCVLMLDELDSIGIVRGGGTEGPVREMDRTVIVLMQELDAMNDGQILIATTNRTDRLDKALKRRFFHKVEFQRFSQEDNAAMLRAFLTDVGMEWDEAQLLSLAGQPFSQAELARRLTAGIVKVLKHGTRRVTL